jgi:hypothetical protein
LITMADDDTRSTRIWILVGRRWFNIAAQRVRSIEAWQPLIAVPWATPFLGLLATRSELIPVLDERLLGCEVEGRRSRVVSCTWRAAVIGVAAREVRFDAAASALASAPHGMADPLEPILDRVCAGLGERAPEIEPATAAG